MESIHMLFQKPNLLRRVFCIFSEDGTEEKGAAHRQYRR